MGFLSSFRRDTWIAVLSCLVISLIALSIRQKIAEPWKGKTADLIYGENHKEISTYQKYAGTLDFYFNRKHPGREQAKVQDWIKIGLWSGCFLASILFGFFALTAKWWVAWCRNSNISTSNVTSGWKAPASSVCILIISLLLASAIRLPCLKGSILWDEQDNHRRSYHGYFDLKNPTDKPVFVEADLKMSIWENRRGNNPHLYSFLANISNSAWRAVTGEPRERSSIIMMRLPSAIFGILSIATVWWMLNAVGLPRLAPLAALLSAVHPMSAEYSFEARAYCLTLFFSPLIMGFAWRIVRYGRWPEHVGLAFSVFCTLFSFPGAIYYVVTVHFLLVALLVYKWRSGNPNSITSLARWLVASAISGALFIWVMSPAIPQMVNYMNNSFQTGVMPPYWYVVSYNLFATGMHFNFPRDPFFTPGAFPPPALGWLTGDYWQAWPVALWALVCGPVLLIAGAWHLIKSANKTFSILAFGGLASGLICVAHHAFITGCYIYSWYAIYCLPILIIFAAAGLDYFAAALSRLSPSRVSHSLASYSLALFVAFWVLAISHPLFVNSGWKTQYAEIHSRPRASGWMRTNGFIGHQEFLRAKDLWVVYEDGYHVVFRNHVDRVDEWSSVIARPLSQWGKFE